MQSRLEPGLSGWTIYLDLNENGMLDAGEPQTITDGDGNYRFENLGGGRYVVREQGQTGFRQTAPRTGTHAVQLAGDGAATFVNFGNVETPASANLSPIVTSSPPNAASVGQLLRYDVTAVDPNGDPVSYSLAMAPDGMTIHPDLGTLIWSPTHEQTGTQRVLVRAADNRGGAGVQSFDLTVQSPNSPPVFASTPPTMAAVGFPFVYPLRAQDADGEAVTFRIGTAPAGVDIRTSEIRNERGDVVETQHELTWTPGAADAGDQTFSVIATDARGAETTQMFVVSVADGAPNSAPVVRSSPRTMTRIGGLYGYLVQVDNADGDRLTFSLDTFPAGMTVSGEGAVRWSPAAGQLGTHPVTIRVSDGRGGEATQSFAVTVVSQDVNRPPFIASNPPTASLLDQTYEYNVTADDPDGDPLTWNLVSGPRGMSIDRLRGTIRWTPDDLQLGPHTVVVQASDMFLATATQTFVVQVNCVNTPPIITSVPLTTAVTGRRYVYPVRAEDLERETLTFALTMSPTNMTVQPATGLVLWTPDTADAGQHDVVVQVTDASGAATTQAYSIDVRVAGAPSNPSDPDSPPNENRPPVITSTPVFMGEVGVVYQYQVQAVDPDGDAVTFDLPQRPAGMTIGAGGLITWTPDSEGEQIVSVQVADEHGATSTQGFAVNITANQPPQILSTAPNSITAGATYRYSLRVQDENLATLKFRLDQAPEGMTIAGLGRILWDTDAADVGLHNVTVTVTDDHGQTATEPFTIAVNADTVAPMVDVVVVRDGAFFDQNVTVDENSDVLLQVTASDNVRVTGLTLSVNGVNLPLDANGRAVFENAMLGQLEVVGAATDAAGNMGEDRLIIDVVDPADTNNPNPANPTDPTLPTPGPMDPSDNQHPFVEITSPAINATVTDLTPIIGTVDDPEDNLWYYRVYTARLDTVSISGIDLSDPDWKVINEGTDEVINGELARFDPSLLTNDPYAIIVAAFDNNGQGFIQPTVVVVEGNVILGNFNLEFTDLSLPLAGIPIEVTRVYDTLNASIEGDFGFGWSLGVQDARILETVPAGTAFIFNKTKVYLTNPAGQRVGYTFDPVCQGSFFGAICTPKFTPDPGVYDELMVDGRFGVGGILGALGGPFNPNEYTLVTKDGLRYRYNQARGLQMITDLNDNVVTFRDDGIVHSSGASIDFIRDHRGRITEIRVPDGAGGTTSIRYAYDAAGDLRSFTDQAGLTTRYEYLANPAHFLDKAFDPLGRQVLEVRYEDNQFVGVFDAMGNQVDQRDYDTDARTAIVRDGNGNPTMLLYDERGNVLEETDPLGNITFREYNDPRNPDLETRIIDRDGNINDREYDARGNLMKIMERGTAGDPIDPPIVTEFAYDGGNRVTSITNARDNETGFTYDSRGNLTTITNAEGNTARFTYDAQGRRRTFTDFNGNTTTFEYAFGDQPTKVIFADQTYQRFAYNQFGQVTLEEFYEADDTLVERRETKYDVAGRVLEEITGGGDDPNHPPTIVRSVYEGHLLDWEIIVNPASPDETPATPVDQRQSRITDFEYDANDNLIRQIDAEGGVVEFRYDTNGNRVLLQDPVGNITTWVYDALNRVSEERDPFYNEAFTIDQALADLSNPSGASCETNTPAEHVRLTCYDGEGNQAKTIDRNGRRREFEYDHAGRLLVEQWFNAPDHSMAPEALVETITFTYDVLGNMLTATDSNSNYAFTYDTLNRLTSVDNNPDGTRDVPRVVLTYGYDPQGNVTLTRDDAGVTVTSTYDARNRLATRSWFDADVPAGETADVDDARVDFEYNAAGREAEVRRYADLDAMALVGRTLRTYDLAGRSDVLDHVNAVDELLAGYDYDYDFSGLLVHEERTHQDPEFAQSIDYRYDLTGQLVDALFSGQDDEHYEYDANGNRITSEVGTDQRNYTTGTANQLESDGIYRYEYDGEGNQVKRIDLTTGETRTFQYDHRNRLVRVDDWSSDPGDPRNPDAGAILTQSVEYTYDALGRRIAREVDPDGAAAQPSEKEFFVYSGDNVWADVHSIGGSVTRYVFATGTDNILAQQSGNGPTMWLLPDYLGTVANFYDAEHTQVLPQPFRSFGLPLGELQLGSPISSWFAGRPFDLDIQTYDLRSRDYSPLLGTLISKDSIGFDGGSYNLYSYVGNSPINFIDPSGTTSVPAYAIRAIRSTILAHRVASLAHYAIVRVGFGTLQGLIRNRLLTTLTQQSIRNAIRQVGLREAHNAHFVSRLVARGAGRGIHTLDDLARQLAASTRTVGPRLTTEIHLPSGARIILNRFGELVTFI